MHEMALADGILAVVLEAAEGRKVRRVCLSIGKLHHVTSDSLQFSYQLLAENTPANEAVLQIEPVEILTKCNACNHEQVCFSLPLICSSCKSYDLTVLQGEEVLVDSVELEDGTLLQRPGKFDDEQLNEHMQEHHGNQSS